MMREERTNKKKTMSIELITIDERFNFFFANTIYIYIHFSLPVDMLSLSEKNNGCELMQQLD
jgi:hypothetical protein